MRRILLIGLWIAAPFLAFAQIDDDTLTVTASRTVYLQPDQVVVGVNVNAATDVALDDVLGALSGTGITAANVSSVNTWSPQAQQQLPTQWSFALPVSFARLNGVLSALAKIQQTMSTNNSGMSLAYFVQYAQVSPELQAANPCAYPSLVSDAQRQAQLLAAAAGVTVGPIVALWDGSTGGTVPTLVYRQGDFSSLLGGGITVAAIYDPTTGNPYFGSTFSTACTMTVQFKLLH